MLTIEYSMEPGNNFLYTVADRLSKEAGKPVYVKDNGLVFPPELAQGRFEYHPLDIGLSMVIIDCLFLEPIQFYRRPMPMNYFQAVSFNLSSISLAIQDRDGAKIHIGDCWEKKIVCSTSENGLGWQAPRNGKIRMLFIHMDKGWTQKKYKIARAPNNIPFVKELKMNLPLQFTLDLDLDLLMCAQDILMTPPPAYMAKLFYKGEVKMLLALVVQRLLKKPAKELKLKYTDIITIMSVVKEIENTFEKPVPSLDEAAQKCLMSQSKFVTLFKSLYNKSYVHFFNEKKMEKAQEFLLQEKDVRDVAKTLGFVNVSHFIKLFKEYYNETPKNYIKMIEVDNNL